MVGASDFEAIAHDVWSQLTAEERQRVGRGREADALASALARIQEDLPQVRPSAATLGEALVGCLRERERVFDDDSIAEVFLASACVEGVQEALLELERRSFLDVEPALRRLRLPAVAFDEVKQILRARLFVVAPGAQRPRIWFEAGRGDLRVLVRVAATRIGLNILEKARGHDSPTEYGLGAELGAGDDPEVMLLRETCQPIFERVLGEVMASLDPRDRTLLRLHLVDHLTIDDVGRIYSVHRATAARWIADAKRRVIDRVQALLRTELRLEDTELMSLFARLDLDVDVTLSRLLASSSRESAKVV